MKHKPNSYWFDPTAYEPPHMLIEVRDKCPVVLYGPDDKPIVRNVVIGFRLRKKCAS